jgi:putative oxidoreductase
MSKFMLSYSSQAYALMRIIVGFLFLWHGTQKLFGFPAPAGPMPPYVQYIAGSIELVGGTMVMIGFFTRWAAFLCSGLMAAAYWIAHGTNALLPIQNRGELAALFCFVFLYVSTRGGGIWSVDDARGE